MISRKVTMVFWTYFDLFYLKLEQIRIFNIIKYAAPNSTRYPLLLYKRKI